MVLYAFKVLASTCRAVSLPLYQPPWYKCIAQNDENSHFETLPQCQCQWRTLSLPLRPKPTQTVLAPTCQNAMESYLPTCINPCKSGDGSCLKKIDLPTQGGGVEVGILGVNKSKVKTPGNVMNCPENL